MEESLNSMYVIVGHNIDYFLKEKGLSQENLGAELVLEDGVWKLNSTPYFEGEWTSQWLEGKSFKSRYKLYV